MGGIVMICILIVLNCVPNGTLQELNDNPIEIWNATGMEVELV